MRALFMTIFLLGFVLVSCKNQEVKVEYKLSDQQLTRLMYDLQWTDATITSISGQKADTLKELFWTRLTTIYGLSRSEIKSEVQKLESDPEKLKTVFDSIKVWSDTIK